MYPRDSFLTNPTLYMEVWNACIKAGYTCNDAREMADLEVQDHLKLKDTMKAREEKYKFNSHSVIKPNIDYDHPPYNIANLPRCPSAITNLPPLPPHLVRMSKALKSVSLHP